MTFAKKVRRGFGVDRELTRTAADEKAACASLDAELVTKSQAVQPGEGV